MKKLINGQMLDMDEDEVLHHFRATLTQEHPNPLKEYEVTAVDKDEMTQEWVPVWSESDLFQDVIKVDEDGIPVVTETKGNQEQKYLAELMKQAKEDKLSELKQARESRIRAPINGFEVDTPEHRENLQGAVNYFAALSQGSGSIIWTKADNREEAVSSDDLTGALDAYVLRRGAMFATYQSLKSAVEASKIIQDVRAIVWPEPEPEPEPES